MRPIMVPGIFTHNIPGIGIGSTLILELIPIPIPISIPGIGGTLVPKHEGSMGFSTEAWHSSAPAYFCMNKLANNMGAKNEIFLLSDLSILDN